MLYEYAIDPDALKDFGTFKYLIEQFGISYGRLISLFPRKWPDKVKNVCREFTYIQKVKLQEELKRLRKQVGNNPGK